MWSALIKEAFEVFFFGDELEDDLLEPDLFFLESSSLFLQELLVGFLLGTGSRGGDAVALQEFVPCVRLLPAWSCGGFAGLLFLAIIILALFVVF
jgi:hypothetical protein